MSTLTIAKPKQLIAYYRVSTTQQGQSGLGLEGQRDAVETFANAAGYTIAASFTEVESGRKSDRPQLAKAIAHAKKARATLAIAKLDRLSRSVAFLANLLESGVEFVACDMPSANRLTTHILAAVAEEEARAISARTKAALGAYKARGGLLGGSLERCRNLKDADRAKGAKQAAKVRRAAALEWYGDLRDTLAEMASRRMTLRAMAERLTSCRVPTRGGDGAPWHPNQVRRALRLLGIERVTGGQE